MAIGPDVRGERTNSERSGPRSTSRQGVASLTAEEAAKVQAQDLGSASKDLHEAIERGNYPQWDFSVQIIEDHDHSELDRDPLDDPKIWPEDQFPLRRVGVMTLNRNVDASPWPKWTSSVENRATTAEEVLGGKRGAAVAAS